MIIISKMFFGLGKWIGIREIRKGEMKNIFVRE